MPPPRGGDLRLVKTKQRCSQFLTVQRNGACVTLQLHHLKKFVLNLILTSSIKLSSHLTMFSITFSHLSSLTPINCALAHMIGSSLQRDPLYLQTLLFNECFLKTFINLHDIVCAFCICSPFALCQMVNKRVIYLSIYQSNYLSIYLSI